MLGAGVVLSKTDRTAQQRPQAKEKIPKPGAFLGVNA